MSAIAVLARVPAPRLPRRVIVALVVLLATGAGGWFALRDSPFVAVQRVRVVGLAGSEAPRIRRALVQAARDMSTLHVREDALRAAVAPFTSVAGVEVRTHFPHALTIAVHQLVPVLVLQSAAGRVPVGADARLLRGVHAESGVPTLAVARVPVGPRATDPRALSALASVAAAPEPLRARLQRAWFGGRGLVLDLRDGPSLIFGTGAAAVRKWAAAARVLGDPSATGALYLDVRIPDRVAAGGVAPVATSTSGAASGAAPPASGASTATPAATPTVSGPTGVHGPAVHARHTGSAAMPAPTANPHP